MNEMGNRGGECVGSGAVVASTRRKKALLVTGRMGCAPLYLIVGLALLAWPNGCPSAYPSSLRLELCRLLRSDKHVIPPQPRQGMKWPWPPTCT